MKDILWKRIKVLGLCFALVLSTCSPAWAELEVGGANADTNSIAIGDATTYAYRQSIAIGNRSLAGEANPLVNPAQTNYLSTAIGYWSHATGMYSTALGLYSTASGYKSTAIGNESVASGASSTATGDFAQATGNRSTAYGANSIASGISSIAIGDTATATGDNGIAIGTAATAANNGVALGEGSTAAANSVALGVGSTAAEGTISVGAVGSERQITNLAAGTADTDAVNVGQLNTGLANLSSDIDVLSYRVEDLDSRISKVGAMSAAISGLMALPYDPDTPTQFQIGAGSYGGEQAVAAGLTYYTSDSMALNLGFSICGGEKMGRIGATWALGHSSGKNKKQTVASLTTEVNELQAQNQKLQEQIDKINQMLEKNANVPK